MATLGKVEVSGLRQFGRALKKVDSDLPKALRAALNECATLLIDETRPLIPKKSGRAARSLKARSTRSEVRVAVGGRLAPYYPWLDFGGRVGRNRSIRREFIKEGRYLYPTLGKNREKFKKTLDGALRGLAEDAGLEIG